MLNLSNESCAPHSAADNSRYRWFRDHLRTRDAAHVEQLVRAAGVFNDEEIAMARELIEQSVGAPNGAGYRFLLADGPAGLEGYICYGPIPGTDGRYELYWIVTAAPVQRRGLARALLVASECRVRAEGGTHLFAETSTRIDYAPAHALYGALGYTRYCAVPDYHGDGDGLAIFGKRL
jgi:GNAT superfamily N-acetyltransferase